MPLRYRHGYAADLHRGLAGPPKSNSPEVPRPTPPDGTVLHRIPARIHRVRAGAT
jgi:hypothetical protein